MIFEDAPIAGVKIIRARRLADERGAFTKTFNTELTGRGAPGFEVREIYHSTSRRGVVRGLHFQTAPFAQAKIIFCLRGAVFDACVDLRRSSPTYGRSFAMELREEEGVGLLVPEGFGHGIQALTDDAVIINIASAVYSDKHEGGVAWDSCGIAWPIAPTGLSDKDRMQPPLAEFETPFA